MITRCPECSTLFKVVADQLKISDGWVRCGQCGQVFDGGANLQKDSVAEVAVPAAVPPDPAIVHDADVAADISDEPQTSLAADAALDQPMAPQERGAESSEPEPLALGPEGEPTFSQPDPELLDTSEAPTDAVTEARDAQDLSIPELSFVRAARRRAFWTSPWLRWVLASSAVVLSLGLVLQLVLHERDRIAATLPEVRPWLRTLCQALGCVIEPLKNIDAITVDSSSFDRVRADVYRLQVTLKNTAGTELALPAVELTLTDTRDAAVLRRVLMPTDFAPAAHSIAAGAEWSAALTVSVAGIASSARIAGYRVLAFYP